MRVATSLRVACLPAIFIAGGLVTWQIGTGGRADSPWPTAILGAIVGFAWCLTGLAAWRRRPENRTGWLMILVGLAWWAGLLQFASPAWLSSIGDALGALFFAVFVHLLLAFPSGRLEARAERILVAVAYVDTTVVLVVDDAVSRTVGIVLLFASLGLLARRWRRATPPWRRVVGPVLWSGVAVVAAFGVLLAGESAGVNSYATAVAAATMLAAVPLAFQIGLLRSRLARGAVADLVVELGGTQVPGGLREGLARALGDPSLEIAYWLPERERYVDVDGRPLELPAPGGDRVATVIERSGRRVAAVLHDVSLRERPELVDAACAAAGLALENERLHAELSARLVDLEESRARIVEVGDTARRRIERDLHDGAQARLVSVAMALGLAESKFAADPAASRRMLDDAREGLQVAMRELRELSRGIHPGVLTERGLAPALRELVDTAPVPVQLAVRLDGRLPVAVEAAAYFVVAEAVANVGKYAGATAMSVSVEQVNGRAVVDIQDDGIGGADAMRGTGLRGLADRLDALGGTLALESPPGQGTRLTAEIPCRS
jgi:signal transduction histidine kinase